MSNMGRESNSDRARQAAGQARALQGPSISGPFAHAPLIISLFTVLRDTGKIQMRSVDRAIKQSYECTALVIV